MAGEGKSALPREASGRGSRRDLLAGDGKENVGGEGVEGEGSECEGGERRGGFPRGERAAREQNQVLRRLWIAAGSHPRSDLVHNVVRRGGSRELDGSSNHGQGGV